MHRLNPRDKYIFIALLQSLEVNSLKVSAYTSIYLKKHLDCVRYSVDLAWQILELGLAKSDKPINQMSMVEIGGGTGIICLVAKYLGFEKVVYSDIYPQSCKDFESISANLNLKTDAIICGSINEVANQFSGKIDLLVSRDVIEHVYNPEQFFKQSADRFEGAIMVHNTSANMYNIFKKRYFAKLHLLDELKGNPNQFKPGDSTESFYRLRYSFIERNFLDLPKAKIIELAQNTRGRIYDDILTDVQRYIDHGVMPKMLQHPTNTCDPTTGNWTENLLSFSRYKSFLNSGNYKVEWYFSPYDQWSNRGFKRQILKILNGIIQRFSLVQRYLAPAVIMVATPFSQKYEHPK